MKNFLVFLLFLFAGGLFCSFQQQEIWWDFVNYHYYNAYAFVTGKTFTNIAPAGVHSYFNPLLDLYTYALVYWFNNYPKVIFFGQGLWLGALWFICFKFVVLVLPYRTLFEKFACCVAFLFSVLGYAIFRQAGSSTNEIPLAVCFLTGFYLLIKYIWYQKEFNVKKLFYIGLILGMSCGLKMTVIPMAVALGIATLLYCKKMLYPFKSLSILGISAFLGFLITNGFWMFLLWTYFKNPFYPFFNNIFKSPFALPVYIKDVYTLPDTIWGYLLFPFEMMKYNYAGSDILNNSFNIPLGLMAGIGILLWTNRKQIYSFLSVFFLSGYVLFLLSTVMLRYTIPLEIISGIVIVCFIRLFPKKYIFPFLLIVLSVNIYAVSNYEQWYTNMKHSEKYIDTPRLILDKDTVLILPQRMLSVFLPNVEGGRFVAGFNQSWRDSQPETDISASGKLSPLFRYQIDDYSKFAAITTGKKDGCMELKQNIYPHITYSICPAPGSEGIVKGIFLSELVDKIK